MRFEGFFSTFYGENEQKCNNEGKSIKFHAWT